MPVTVILAHKFRKNRMVKLHMAKLPENLVPAKLILTAAGFTHGLQNTISQLRSVDYILLYWQN